MTTDGRFALVPPTPEQLARAIKTRAKKPRSQVTLVMAVGKTTYTYDLKTRQMVPETEGEKDA